VQTSTQLSQRSHIEHTMCWSTSSGNDFSRVSADSGFGGYCDACMVAEVSPDSCIFCNCSSRTTLLSYFVKHEKKFLPVTVMEFESIELTAMSWISVDTETSERSYTARHLAFSCHHQHSTISPPPPLSEIIYFVS
jgi:hypothetical protein